MSTPTLAEKLGAAPLDGASLRSPRGAALLHSTRAVGAEPQYGRSRVLGGGRAGRTVTQAPPRQSDGFGHPAETSDTEGPMDLPRWQRVPRSARGSRACFPPQVSSQRVEIAAQTASSVIRGSRHGRHTNPPCLCSGSLVSAPKSLRRALHPPAAKRGGAGSAAGTELGLPGAQLELGEAYFAPSS